MELKTKFEIGQEVWCIGDYYSTFETCQLCGSTRTVKHGKWIVGGWWTIDRIKIYAEADRISIRYEDEDVDVECEPHNYGYEDKLWASEIEAQAECDRRNKLISEEATDV